MRDVLIAMYLDYLNNYLTVETFAEHAGLTREHAEELLDLAKRVRETPHPDA